MSTLTLVDAPPAPVTTGPPAAPERGSGVDVVYVLMLLQATFGVVATLGLLVLMGGNPAVTVVPLLYGAALLTLASRAVRRRRWALIATIVVEGGALGGVVLEWAVGLLPQVDFQPTITGLVTTIALPVAVIVLCARALAR